MLEMCWIFLFGFVAGLAKSASENRIFAWVLPVIWQTPPDVLISEDAKDGVKREATFRCKRTKREYITYLVKPSRELLTSNYHVDRCVHVPSNSPMLAQDGQTSRWIFTNQSFKGSKWKELCKECWAHYSLPALAVHKTPFLSSSRIFTCSSDWKT